MQPCLLFILASNIVTNSWTLCTIPLYSNLLTVYMHVLYVAFGPAMSMCFHFFFHWYLFSGFLPFSTHRMILTIIYLNIVNISCYHSLIFLPSFARNLLFSYWVLITMLCKVYCFVTQFSKCCVSVIKSVSVFCYLQN